VYNTAAAVKCARSQRRHWPIASSSIQLRYMSIYVYSIAELTRDGLPTKSSECVSQQWLIIQCLG
jgi:hypothetical protein